MTCHQPTQSILSPTYPVRTIIISALLFASSGLQTRIQDGMASLWRASLGAGEHPPMGSTNPASYRPTNWVYRLRTHPAYQETFRRLKWTIRPAIFGIAIWLGLLWVLWWLVGWIGLAILAIPIGIRLYPTAAEESEQFCRRTVGTPVDRPMTAAQPFATRDPCFFTGWEVEAGNSYRIILTVTSPWID